MMEINLILNCISNKTSGQEYYNSSKYIDMVRPIQSHIDLDVPTLETRVLGSCPRSTINSVSHLE